MSEESTSSFDEKARRYSSSVWAIVTLVYLTTGYACWYFHDNVHPIIGSVLILLTIYFILGGLTALVASFRTDH